MLIPGSPCPGSAVIPGTGPSRAAVGLGLLGIQLLKRGVTAVCGAAAAAGPGGIASRGLDRLCLCVKSLTPMPMQPGCCKLPRGRQSLALLGAAAKPGNGGAVGLCGLIHDPGALPATQPLGPAALAFSTVSIMSRFIHPGDAVSLPSPLLQGVAFPINYTAGERPLRLSVPRNEKLPDLLFLPRGHFLPKRPSLFGFPGAEAPFAKFPVFNYPRCKDDA